MQEESIEQANEIAIPVCVTEFAAAALIAAHKATLQTADFLPRVDAVLVSVGDNMDIHGARVFFEHPVKACWVSVAFNVSWPYEEARKKDTPLSDTYFMCAINTAGRIDVESIATC